MTRFATRIGTSAKIITVLTLGVMTSGAAADPATQQGQPALNYVNDMPYPSEVPAYTPRVVFADLPGMTLRPLSGDAIIFADMPFPEEMPTYTPVRYFSDLPVAPYDVTFADHAMLVID